MVRRSVKSILLFSLIITIYFISITESLKCYQCKEPDPRCRDTFQNDTAFFKPCPLNATKCRKYKWEVGDGVTYFERGCAVHGEVSRREGRNCIERVGTFRTRMWYCICDNKDGCNRAISFLKQDKLLVLLTTSLTIFLFIFNIK